MHQWYYRDPQSRKIGPLSDQEFAACVSEGEIQLKTRIWRSGLADWTTYEALLAHAATCQAHASGPIACVAPQSRSGRTFVAFGVSATHRRPHRWCMATPVASARGLIAPAFEKCPGCREDVPTQLLRGVGEHRRCGFCVQKYEAKIRRDKLREAKSAGANWIGKFLVRCALVAGVFVLGRVIFSGPHRGSEGTSTLPVVEAPTVLLGGVEMRPMAGR